MYSFVIYGAVFGVIVGVELVNEWMATVQRHMHVKKEPHQYLPLFAICAIDCGCESVDKERRAVALHGRKLMICARVNIER